MALYGSFVQNMQNYGYYTNATRIYTNCKIIKLQQLPKINVYNFYTRNCIQIENIYYKNIEKLFNIDYRLF